MNKADIIKRLDEITGNFLKDIPLEEGKKLSMEKWKLLAMASTLLDEYRNRLCGICNISGIDTCEKCKLDCHDIPETKEEIKPFRKYLKETFENWTEV